MTYMRQANKHLPSVSTNSLQRFHRGQPLQRQFTPGKHRLVIACADLIAGSPVIFFFYCYRRDDKQHRCQLWRIRKRKAKHCKKAEKWTQVVAATVLRPGHQDLQRPSRDIRHQAQKSLPVETSSPVLPGPRFSRGIGLLLKCCRGLNFLSAGSGRPILHANYMNVFK